MASQLAGKDAGRLSSAVMHTVYRLITAIFSGLGLAGLVTLGAVSWLACSGASSSSAPPPESPAPDSKEARRLRALEELQIRQQAACERVAPVFTGCAIEDARATLPPAELAKLDLDSTAPLHQAWVLDTCMSTDMSPRQVKVYEDCVAGDTTCALFIDCLEQAKPQK